MPTSLEKPPVTLLDVEERLIDPELVTELFQEIMKGHRSPAEQLELISMAMQQVLQARNSNNRGDELLEEAKQAFFDIMNNEAVTPLVRWAARTQGQLIMNEQMGGIGRKHLKLEEILQSSTENGQDLLHIARDAVVKRDDVSNLMTSNGKGVSLSDISQRNDLHLSEEESTLLIVTLDPDIRDTIETELGLYIDNLTLGAQLKLVKILANEEDIADVNRLTRCLASTWGEQRYSVAQAFLATEFGDDYADKILSIAEHTSSEDAGEIFETVNAFREHSAKLARWYEDYDPQFTKASERAMNERLTDVLYAIEELARTGRLEIDTAPHRNTPDYENDGRYMLRLHSVESGIEVLKGLEKTLVLQNEIITASDVQVSRVTAGKSGPFSMYRFSSEQYGEVLLYVRPEGASSYDRNFEYGNYSGVEASISFIVNPTDPHHLRSDKDPHGVSVRFDREGRMISESPFSEERSPIREDGSISVDISSGVGDGRNMPVKIGRLIAAGNLLRAAKTGSEESLHHNTNGFDHDKYGSAKGFAALARHVANMAEAMMQIQQQESRASRRRNTPADYPKAA